MQAIALIAALSALPPQTEVQVNIPLIGTDGSRVLDVRGADAIVLGNTERKGETLGSIITEPLHPGTYKPAGWASEGGNTTQADVPIPRQETLSEIQEETVKTLSEVQGYLSEVLDRIDGPKPTDPNGCGFPPGMRGGAYEARERARAALIAAREILGKL